MPNDYDFYLRERTINDGDWLGFALAWKGLAGLPGLQARPHKRWFPWILDPTQPDDPTEGHWGVLQWRLSVALIDGFVGLAGRPPDDARTGAQMRDDLLAFMPFGNIDLMDLDGLVYQVRMTRYEEESAELYDAAHPAGGMLAVVEFARVAV